jgi:hypothetical protein
MVQDLKGMDLTLKPTRHANQFCSLPDPRRAVCLDELLYAIPTRQPQPE